MEKLKDELEKLINQIDNPDSFREEVETLVSIFPFNEYEYIISSLLSKKIIDLQKYQNIRNEYIDRNLFLHVFEISAPRGFGDTWAFGHLMSIEPELKRPNKEIDPTYNGEYDLYVRDEEKIIKIEVKASRAVDREKPDEPLYRKALSSKSERPFLMNFQQLKPSCCDVFLWIAVYRDTIKYWVIKNETVKNHKDFTNQHRTASSSGEDVYEGQIMITKDNIQSIADFEVTGRNILEAIKIQHKIKSEH